LLAERMAHIARKRLLNPKQLALLVVGLTLAVYSGAIFLITRTLRDNVRDQIISRDAEILRAVSMMLQLEQTEKAPSATFGESEQFEVLLKTSQLKGVMGIRLFDATGKLIASFPVYVRDSTLATNEIASLHELKPIAYFYSKVELADLFRPDAKSPIELAKTTPVLEAIIPLHAARSYRLQGIAQFLIDGRSLAAEFEALDKNLFRQAVLIFFAGAFLMVPSLGWVFYRLQRANRLLRERSENLLQANQELALVTRTSAVGIVSAHLLHEMKSQLFGLRNLLLAGSEGSMDWRIAADATKRLQNLVGQMVEIIRNDEGTSLHYEISLDDLAVMISAQAEPLAKAAGVRFTVDIQKSGTVSNRMANLLLIILMNLIDNAIQASAKHRLVKLILTSEKGRTLCFVKDEGVGVPPDVQKSLFRPVVSRKEGGSGIGLALSKQLANHLDGELELKETGRNGTTFMLSVPESLEEVKTETATF
jgi:signal transduction histidine kinase